MRCLVLLILCGMLGACDAPRQEPQPVALPPEPAAPVLSQQQVDALSGRCARTAQEEIRRAGNEGAADFASHYNVKMNACFYMLTVAQPSGSLRKTLTDAGTRELYGEFQGTATQMTCRVESLYCASAGEWDVLVAAYMKD